jgi:sortase A
MKKYWVILVVLGILLISYPFIDRTYTWYMQKKAFDDINAYNNNDNINNDKIIENYNILDGIFKSSTNEKNNNQINNTQSNTHQNMNSKKNKKKSPIGVLKIEKIGLKLPILYGTSYGNLKVGAAQVEGTSPIGEIGNTALAAHRSHTYGSLFNRLNELEKGDKIIIESGKNIYTYEVYKRSIVEPNDITVLYRNKKDKILTLITCDPVYNPTHRLVVQGILK